MIYVDSNWDWLACTSLFFQNRNIRYTLRDYQPLNQTSLPGIYCNVFLLLCSITKKNIINNGNEKSWNLIYLAGTLAVIVALAQWPIRVAITRSTERIAVITYSTFFASSASKTFAAGTLTVDKSAFFFGRTLSTGAWTTTNTGAIVVAARSAAITKFSET